MNISTEDLNTLKRLGINTIHMDKAGTICNTSPYSKDYLVQMGAIRESEPHTIDVAAELERRGAEEPDEVIDV